MYSGPFASPEEAAPRWQESSCVGGYGLLEEEQQQEDDTRRAGGRAKSEQLGVLRKEGAQLEERRREDEHLEALRHRVRQPGVGMHQLEEVLRREHVLLVEGSVEVGGRLRDIRAQQQVGRELEGHSDPVEEDSLRVDLVGGKLGKLEEELRKGAEAGNNLGILTLLKELSSQGVRKKEKV